MTDSLPTVELPTNATKVRPSKRASAALPDIDHTIKIPERMAASCWKALFICFMIASIAFIDARDPQFMILLDETAQAVIHRLSLENAVALLGNMYQSIVSTTVYVFSGN